MNVLSKIKIIYSERIPSFLLFVSKKLKTVQTIVYLEIDEQNIRISPKLSAQDEECETLAVESSTGKVHIRISSQFLIDALEHIETESFALEFSSTMRPIVVKPIGEVGHICIIMPMRLEDLDRHFNNFGSRL